MDIQTENELVAAIEAGRRYGVVFATKLAGGLLDEAEFDRVRSTLEDEGRDFLLWAACVACSPRLASHCDRALVVQALPGWCLTASVARRVEGLGRSIGIALRGYTRNVLPEVEDLAGVLVDQAVACVARRQALNRCA